MIGDEAGLARIQSGCPIVVTKMRPVSGWSGSIFCAVELSVMSLWCKLRRGCVNGTQLKTQSDRE